MQEQVGLQPIRRNLGKSANLRRRGDHQRLAREWRPKTGK